MFEITCIMPDGKERDCESCSFGKCNEWNEEKQVCVPKE